MRRGNRWAERIMGERGSAALEFIAVGVLMLVPVTYLVIALGEVQSQAFGVEASARFASRIVANGSTTDAERVAADVAAQYDIDPDALEVTVTCVPSSAECPRAGATVVVTVRAEVTLPLVPPALRRMASVPVEASAAHKVSRYGGDG